MISTQRYYCKKAILITLILLSAINVFTKTNYAANTDMMKIFCIIPIGHIDDKTLQHTQKELEKRFNVIVECGRQLEEPTYAYHKHKKQYNSTTILKKIYKLKLTGYDRILGIVDVDLYVPERTFVFGGADVKKKVSVISLTRLKQKFYNLSDDSALFNYRTIIEAVHELGHTYGLYHCKNNKCVMFLSNTINDTDHKGADLCSKCKEIMEKKKDTLKPE
ncbi:MAG: archaemetzincin family Zn-dependent metalloprotease [Candidatus Scalindua sp.]|jgi:archaemetzincin|nr:archaemetzincin family Zn-dependent metalloprotease [Candidatus Scalindua sp.]MBT6048288.1 archaemetzincin family Zn-dependent metalloprotease [Candidatus Scalindua sp.]MBT6228225.1 archaemetzincin family Zn-dependent metalloprotease [Candidatus Scalindua sp.]MBT6564131.1 archaemetzincin family Zn-dependent metalloprotease [Candidatus Scalindua sp.]MBT7211625.1 archaemetzincin family Zn-dependent metalloprotease [Candidatus Scalindua sp.]